MNSKEYKQFLESYNAVYEQTGVKVPSGASDTEALKGLIPKGDKVHEIPKKKSTLQNASYEPEGELVEDHEIDDIFNCLLEYLVAEGYADTNENALVIMANMSDGWGHNLIEATLSAKAARAGKDIGKPGKMFSKISKEAGKRYGSEESGKKVAGAILAKMRAKASR